MSLDHGGTTPQCDFGNAFSFFDDPTLTDPYALFAAARADEPIFYSERYGMWFVTRYDDVVHVLRDPTTFSSKDVVPEHLDLPGEVLEILGELARPRRLVNSDGPHHTRLRRFMSQGFTSGAIEALRPEIEEIASQLIDQLTDANGADLIETFALPLPLTVIMRLLGVPEGDLEKCRAWSEEISTLHWSVESSSAEHLAECARGMRDFHEYTAALVGQRLREPKDDLISLVLHAPIDDQAPLTEEELVSLLPGLVIAGHETTANMIGNTLRLLLEVDGLIERVATDEQGLAAAIEEGLRVDSPVIGMPRTVSRDTQLSGVPLSVGEKVFVLFTSANHDEAYYPDPECFDVARPKGSTMLSFGRGIHFCLGAALARLEGRIAISLLARRVRGLRLAPGADLSRTPSAQFRAYRRLDVEWDEIIG